MNAPVPSEERINQLQALRIARSRASMILMAGGDEKELTEGVHQLRQWLHAVILAIEAEDHE